MAKKSTALVSVQELERQLAIIAKPSAIAQASAEPVFSTSNIIRATNARQFKFGDDVVPKPLKVVILAAVHYQAYYDEIYDPDNKIPPVCCALANTEIELIPHESAPQKQAENCALCKQNKPGSGAKGGYTRACSGRRRLAILSLDDKQDDPTVFSIEISPGGLRDYSGWVKNLTTVEGIPTYMAATSLDFFEVTAKDTWFIKATYIDRLTRIRPEWLTPGRGVKIGSEGWLDATIIGQKVRGVIESKMLLSPPSFVKPENPKGKKAGKPVTGKERVSVKEAKARRKAS